MYYYINDYDYEKHPLVIEEGDKSQKTGTWLDMPQLYFGEGNMVKAGYSISLVNGDIPIVTFYNDVTLQAKDGHKLSVEEITIFMLLLMSETILYATEHMADSYTGEPLTDVLSATPENTMEFVQDRMNGLN